MEIKIGKLYVRDETVVQITALPIHPHENWRFVCYQVLENDLNDGVIFMLPRGEFEHDFKPKPRESCPRGLGCGPC